MSVLRGNVTETRVSTTVAFRADELAAISFELNRDEPSRGELRRWIAVTVRRAIDDARARMELGERAPEENVRF